MKNENSTKSKNTKLFFLLFSALSIELKVTIFQFLYEDLHHAKAVNREWRNIILEHRLLFHLYNIPGDRLYKTCANREIFKISGTLREILLSAKPRFETKEDILDLSPLLSNSLSPDGKHILSLGQGGIVRIIDVDKTMKNAESATWNFALDMKEPSCVGFSADGKYVIACNQAGFVEIRNVLNNTKESALQLDLPNNAKINHITYHAGQQLIAIVYNEKYINTYTIDGKLELEIFNEHHTYRSIRIDSEIRSLKTVAINFSFDGNYLITATEKRPVENAAILFWETRIISRPSEFLEWPGGGEYGVSACCFSRDGNYAAIPSMMSAISIWDVKGNYRVYRQHQYEGGGPFGIAFDDSNNIVTASEDAIIKYQFPYQQPEAKKAQNNNEEKNDKWWKKCIIG